MRLPSTSLSDFDRYLLGEGTYERAYEKLGAHVVTEDGQQGVRFAVWAPNAEDVSVVGEFNGWKSGVSPMRARDVAGVWDAFVPDIGPGALYKYHILSRYTGYSVDKADPYEFAPHL